MNPLLILSLELRKGKDYTFLTLSDPELSTTKKLESFSVSIVIYSSLSSTIKKQKTVKNLLYNVLHYKLEKVKKLF